MIDAKEIDVDAISDGSNIFIAGILEHIEQAGVHSWRLGLYSSPQTLSRNILGKIEEITKTISKKLKIVGFINIQFAIKDDKIYVIEVNPRASRTIPFISKAIGVPLANLATKVMLGKKLKNYRKKSSMLNYVCVKESVFPFDRFPWRRYNTRTRNEIYW